MPNTSLFDQPSNQLKNTILSLNNAYRAGNPETSDEQYDRKLEQYRSLVNPSEYASLLRLLTEPGGDVVHSYLVGSLKKVKFGENQLIAWVKKCGLAPSLLAMSKIDGASFVATYIDGALVKGSSRGDGYSGQDLTEKLLYILPTTLPRKVTFDIRGELTLTGEDHIKLGFKNRRNGTCGLINRDNAKTEDIRLIKAFAYQIKSGYKADAPVYEQLTELMSLGFATPEFVPSIDTNLIPDAELEEHLASLMADLKNREPYSIDGLVLCAMDYCIEDAFLPDGMIAFKVNADAVQTTVSDIEWNISKNGLCKPVVLIKPVEIDGSTVSRVTGYNAQWLLDNGIGAGALVGVIKSGEIIPKIIEVYRTAPVVLLGECPSCGTSLDKIGVDLVCTNDFCGAAGVKEVESFLVKLDIDGVKATTLENWGIRSLDDLLGWSPDRNFKSQTNLYSELAIKVFNAPADRLFAAMLFDGFGRKSVSKLIEFYGCRMAATGAVRLAAQGSDVKMPEGFGMTSMAKAAPSWDRNLEMLGRICADPRYTEPVDGEKAAVGGKLEGKTFLFTGTISMPRKQAEALVTGNGGSIASGVSKTLSFLIAGEAAGSKLDKARKLGVAILTEMEFKGMVAA